ncbi:hypothetical protein HLRTI_002896 [Halorhabdus tiamatea SARL4B]|uniref:Uncharacterized protein n=1 Tax=Halorhabdus tiamatea SARL4B TaxID=1033806 RepID=U2DGF5_9EURY|nr:hypothetical protein HLRTI_002896 [Halorhabdus tiamatea SARL4B]
MTGECIKCGSRDTELWRGDDGHFRKECGNCGYVGGPYVNSGQGTSEYTPTPNDDVQEADDGTRGNDETHSISEEAGDESTTESGETTLADF